MLLPGDVVRLRVETATTRELAGLVVDAAGTLHVPLLGDVPVTGRTLSEAEQAIETEIRRFERFARCALTIEDAAGHRATIAGAVEKPGRYAVTPNLRVAELVALAGGPAAVTSGTQLVTAGDLAAARVVREGVALPISVERAVHGDPRHNTYVRPGDLLYIPMRRRTQIAVLGEVKDPRVVDHRVGMRASEALAAAGGPLRGAKLADVRLVRGDLSRPTVWRIDVAALVAGHGHDVELLDGDVLFVSRTGLASTLDLVQKLVPALAVVTAGITLSR